MLLAAAVTVPVPLPGASHSPAGSPLAPPTVTRSGMSSPVRSASVLVAAGAASKVTARLSPTLPPVERLVTVRVLTSRVGATVMVAVPAVAVTMPGGPSLSWYW
jgi:hypothetical protein